MNLSSKGTGCAKAEIASFFWVSCDCKEVINRSSEFFKFWISSPFTTPDDTFLDLMMNWSPISSFNSVTSFETKPSNKAKFFSLFAFTVISIVLPSSELRLINSLTAFSDCLWAIPNWDDSSSNSDCELTSFDAKLITFDSAVLELIEELLLPCVLLAFAGTLKMELEPLLLRSWISMKYSDS